MIKKIKYIHLQPMAGFCCINLFRVRLFSSGMCAFSWVSLDKFPLYNLIIPHCVYLQEKACPVRLLALPDTSTTTAQCIYFLKNKLPCALIPSTIRNFVIEGVACQLPSTSNSSITNFLNPQSQVRVFIYIT